MKNSNIFLCSLISLSLAACGGGGGSGSAGTNSSGSSLSSSSAPSSDSSSSASSESSAVSLTQTGYLVDSGLANVDYRSESHSGVTGANGEFEYEPGETVIFSLGDLELGRLKGGAFITPVELTGSADSSAQAVRNMARLLQSLDTDGNASNGISISDAAKTAATSLDWNASAEDFAAAALNLVSNGGQIPARTALIDEADALVHLEDTLLRAETCPGPRTYSLVGTDVVVQSLIDKDDELALYPITGSFTLEAAQQDSNLRACALNATEGYVFGTDYCTSIDSSLALLNIPMEANFTGTVANNSATIFVANGGVGSEYGREVVDAYMQATAEEPCYSEPISPGSYVMSGVEYQFRSGNKDEEDAWESYMTDAVVTVGADSCSVTSSEGDWACLVEGNNFYGQGDAAQIQGTITQRSLTYVLRYNSQDGEGYYGYAHGERQPELQAVNQ